MLQKLVDMFRKLFSRSAGSGSSPSAGPEGAGQPPVNEEEVRKRMQGLGYLE